MATQPRAAWYCLGCPRAGKGPTHTCQHCGSTSWQGGPGARLPIEAYHDANGKCLNTPCPYHQCITLDPMKVVQAVAALAEWHIHPINGCPACLDEIYRRAAVAIVKHGENQEAGRAGSAEHLHRTGRYSVRPLWHNGTVGIHRRVRRVPPAAVLTMRTSSGDLLVKTKKRFTPKPPPPVDRLVLFRADGSRVELGQVMELYLKANIGVMQLVGGQWANLRGQIRVSGILDAPNGVIQVYP